ncbi:hypothetical protein WJX72_012449 [[Myrmecia] bisecta]|uniref:Alpha-1,3-glucosyltransferase n=1 Tax=[Myrmecia] bisecta TaxID=41462 RepID=A0AAW1QTU9_9CHLO
MAVAILVRLAVGLHSYSGAGMPPTYGDYEAQRHWMEITINTPVSQWYTETDHNPLQYWGLDYPPLTAYQSWLCGKVLHKLEPGAVALGSSRGYETPSSKTYLRWSVIAFDVLVFFPAAYACLKVFGRQRSRTQQLWLLLAVLMQPAAVLIDHGHFQYNNISLGLSAGAAAAVAGGWECLGSMLYCLSLNHKQMSLFFAPAFFAHLLGKCLQQPSYSGKALSVLKLGAVVMAAFAACWAPFLTSRQSALQVLHRLMPVRRGLFEDYVANFWCATHIAIKWKQIFSKEALVRVCAVTTLVAASPAMLQQLRCPSPRGLLICMANSSLAFFLFAYQVHEKSILLPLLPVTLLAAEETCPLEPDSMAAIDESAIKRAVKERKAYILGNLDSLNMKACRKLLEEDLGLPDKALAGHKGLISELVDKVVARHAAAEKHDPDAEAENRHSNSEAPSKRAAAKARRRPATADASTGSVEAGDEEEEPAKKKRKGSKSEKLRKPEKPAKREAPPGPKQYSKKVEQMRNVCRKAGINIPPAIYKKSSEDGSLEMAFVALLEKHNLSRHSDHAEIEAAKKALQLQKDLEGIDTTNIIEGGRRSRRAAAPQINYAAALKSAGSDDESEDEDDSDDDEDADVGSDEDEAVSPGKSRAAKHPARPCDDESEGEEAKDAAQASGGASGDGSEPEDEPAASAEERSQAAAAVSPNSAKPDAAATAADNNNSYSERPAVKTKKRQTVLDDSDSE